MNRYFYVDIDGKQKGTFTPEELKKENIKRETLVWTQGLEQWTRAENVDELKPLFSEYVPRSINVSESASRMQSPYVDSALANSEPEQKPLMPKTWMVESILVTVLPLMLCCNVFSLLGVVAIVYAGKTQHYYNIENYEASSRASRKARLWVRIALGVTIGIGILLIAFAIILFASFAADGISSWEELFSNLSSQYSI